MIRNYIFTYETCDGIKRTREYSLKLDELYILIEQYKSTPWITWFEYDEI